MVVERNNMITELPCLAKEYNISVDVLITKYGAGWQSVLQLTKGSKIGSYGDRIPGLWLYQDKQLYIASLVGGNANQFYTHKSVLDLDQWITVQIAQTLTDNKAGRQCHEH